LNRILHPKVSAEYFKVLNRAFKKARVHGPSLVTSIGRIKNPDMVAEVADMLLRHEGVEWVLAMGTFRRAIILSVRTSDIAARAGDLVQGVVRGLGKAGGHGMMAGGKVDLNGQPAQELEALIQERFLKALGARNKPVEALV
jgi:nanoRNase/pAp phosphatase (c-di-AMP/oligoRNAs hydrolase)